MAFASHLDVIVAQDRIEAAKTLLRREPSRSTATDENRSGPRQVRTDSTSVTMATTSSSTKWLSSPQVAPPQKLPRGAQVDTVTLKPYDYGSARACRRASAKRANASSRSVGRSTIGVT